MKPQIGNIIIYKPTFNDNKEINTARQETYRGEITSVNLSYDEKDVEQEKPITYEDSLVDIKIETSPKIFREIKQVSRGSKEGQWEFAEE